MNQELRFAQKGLVLNKERTKVLVIKYSSNLYNNTKLAGKYALPGGRFEFGEEVDHQIIREVKEETGVIVKPLLPFYTWTWRYQKEDIEVQIVAIARVCIYKSGQVIKHDDSESNVEKVEWINVSNLNLENFVIDERPIIEKFLQYSIQSPF